MSKQELFALFVEFDNKRISAISRFPLALNRADELDDILSELLHKLAQAAKD